MSEPIKAGDLVQVVRLAGYCHCHLGEIVKVVSLEECNPRWNCRRCGFSRFHRGLWAVTNGGSGLGHNVTRLKRIPPLSELDDVKKDEEIHA